MNPHFSVFNLGMPPPAKRLKGIFDDLPPFFRFRVLNPEDGATRSVLLNPVPVSKYKSAFFVGIYMEHTGKHGNIWVIHIYIIRVCIYVYIYMCVHICILERMGIYKNLWEHTETTNHGIVSDMVCGHPTMRLIVAHPP